MKGLPQGEYYGVANVGTRPTVCGTKALLETHLFDFDDEIYGEHVDVAFLHHIREERKFESFEDLKAQIVRDAEAARRWLADDRGGC